LAEHTQETFVGITKDRYNATYEGHTIEVISNNWDKTLNLWIDGNKVASESRLLPHDITLTKTFEYDGVPHAVVVKSVVHFPSTTVTLEIDGKGIILTKTE
jgi:hypothetical protein